MAQKCFEAYVTSSGLNSQEASLSIQTKQKEPLVPEKHLIDSETRRFLSNFMNSDSDTEIDNFQSSRLLINSTTSIILEQSRLAESELTRISEVFDLSTIFLVPFRQLMQSKRLDAHLQEAVMASLRVLIECGLIRSYKGWECVFACLSRISLSTKQFQVKQIGEVESNSFMSLDLNMESSKLLIWQG